MVEVVAAGAVGRGRHHVRCALAVGRGLGSVSRVRAVFRVREFLFLRVFRVRDCVMLSVLGGVIMEGC